jgi:transposase
MAWLRKKIIGGKTYLYEYESIRIGDEVKSKYIGARGILNDDGTITPTKQQEQQINWRPPERSYRAGDVEVLWQIAEELHLAQIIDRICQCRTKKNGASPGKLLTLWAINRALDPESASQMDSWLLGTELPTLANLSEKSLNKNAFLDALDAVCSQDSDSDRLIDQTPALDEMMYAQWRDQHPLPQGVDEILAVDMTPIIVYGETCPLTSKGYNPDEAKHQQINLTVIISKHDGQPLAHKVHPGNHASMTTMQGLLPRLSDFSLSEGTIIWDRGNTSQQTVTTLERNGWKVICGVPKVSSEVRTIIKENPIPETVDYLVPCKDNGALYAVKIRAPLYGREREVVVYRNIKKAVQSVKSRNKALYEISLELDRLKREHASKDRKDLNVAINEIITGWKTYFTIQFPEDESIIDFSWEINVGRVETAKAMDGTFVLYATDEHYSAIEVVRMYMEKDVVEKAFQVMKSVEDIKPVRHRLESRVRAYVFVCMLAFRLHAALRARINSSTSKKIKMNNSEFLKVLKRVERADIQLGKGEIEVCYMNLTKDIVNQLVALGMKNLLVSGRRKKA